MWLASFSFCSSLCWYEWLGIDHLPYSHIGVYYSFWSRYYHRWREPTSFCERDDSWRSFLLCMCSFCVRRSPTLLWNISRIVCLPFFYSAVLSRLCTSYLSERHTIFPLLHFHRFWSLRRPGSRPLSASSVPCRPELLSLRCFISHYSSSIFHASPIPGGRFGRLAYTFLLVHFSSSGFASLGWWKWRGVDEWIWRGIVG